MEFSWCNASDFLMNWGSLTPIEVVGSRATWSGTLIVKTLEVCRSIVTSRLLGCMSFLLCHPRSRSGFGFSVFLHVANIALEWLNSDKPGRWYSCFVFVTLFQFLDFETKSNIVTHTPNPLVDFFL